MRHVSKGVVAIALLALVGSLGLGAPPAAAATRACTALTVPAQESDAILLPVAATGTVASVSLDLAWSGPANADVVIGLQSPGEAAAAITVAGPGSGGSARFRDSGSPPASGASSITGTVAPLEPFAGFTGQPAAGEWSLLLLNLSPSTALRITSCTLTVTSADTEPWSPTVTRVAGSDRYAAAVNVSKAAFPGAAPRVPVVYVVSGVGYADALSAGPAAAHGGGPLLLTPTDSLPVSVRTEIRRLEPQAIVVVGGANSVSARVLQQLRALQTETERIERVDRVGGADRYATSRAVVERAFGASGPAVVYVATGAGFPDALSAGAAAGSVSGAVLLVNGSASTVDSPTRTLLAKPGIGRIVIAGGRASVSAPVETALNSIAPTTRQGGADRFATSVAINTDAFATSDRALLVTGLKFPDALAGSAWGGRIAAPLYVATADCVPAAALAAMRHQGVTRITLIGGTASLGAAVQALTPC